MVAFLEACGSGRITSGGPGAGDSDAASVEEDAGGPLLDAGTLAPDGPVLPAPDGRLEDAPAVPRDGAPADAAPNVVDSAPWVGGDPCPPAGTPCRILPLGDSITFGVGGTGGGYRVPLFRHALRDRHAITFVGTQMNGPAMVDGAPFPQLHEGHSGWVIIQLTNIIERVLASEKPHIVTLMIGTNDISASFDPPTAPARLGTLLDRMTAAAPNTLIVVAQITPTTANDAGNAKYQAYNAGIKSVVEARMAAGKRLALVDMFGAFYANPNYRTELMADGLHPKDAGYAVMADVWYRALQQLLK